MNVSQHSTSTGSPVLAILASLVTGAVLAITLLLGPASGASEPMITGSVMFAFGLGVLLFKSVDFPKVLGALVAIAGVGYLADSFGTILVPDYTLTISVFTFIGEALLIVWLFKLAIKGPRRSDSPRVIGSPVLASEAAAS